MDSGTICRASDLPGLRRDRWRPIAELLVVVGLLEVELWSMRASGPAWLNALVYGVIVLTAWLSFERRRRAGFVAAFAEVGAPRAWLEASLACAVLSAALTLSAPMVGDANETFEFVFLDKGPAKFASWLVGKFAAALVQQLALQLFLWPTCFEVTRGRASGAMLAAAIFGLVHLPSPTLVAITLIAGLAWVADSTSRSGRLAPLVASATWSWRRWPTAAFARAADLRHAGRDRPPIADMKPVRSTSADPKARQINRRLKEQPRRA